MPSALDEPTFAGMVRLGWRLRPSVVTITIEGPVRGSLQRCRSFCLGKQLEGSPFNKRRRTIRPHSSESRRLSVGIRREPCGMCGALNKSSACWTMPTQIDVTRRARLSDPSAVTSRMESRSDHAEIVGPLHQGDSARNLRGRGLRLSRVRQLSGVAIPVHLARTGPSR
jgi:hypothetical protein